MMLMTTAWVSERSRTDSNNISYEPAGLIMTLPPPPPTVYSVLKGKPEYFGVVCV